MDRGTKAFCIIVLCGIIGILFAILLQVLYTDNVAVPELLATVPGLTLPMVQFIVFLFWEIVGIGVAAIAS
jgi:hypothetical protein